MISATNIRALLTEHRVPESCHRGIEDYLLLRCPTGSFLQAVLENNLMAACMYADSKNLSQLHRFASFLYNDLPSPASKYSPWGSAEQVKAWLDPDQPPPDWG